jgi:ABC-2 type transport system permease protein
MPGGARTRPVARASFAARVRAMCIKEVLQLARDRATLGMLLGVPLVQVLLFGFAIELAPRTLPVTVVAGSPEVTARVTRWLQDDSTGAVVRRASSARAASALLRRGETLVVVDLDASPARVTVDGSDPVLATHALTAIDRFTRRMADPYEGLPEFAPAMRVDTVFNPQLRTQPYLVSGLMGLILTMTLVMMSALTVARERERGTLEGLKALEMRPLELAVGKLVPYFVLGAVQGLAVLAVGHLAFGVTVAGSWLALGVATAVFAVANLALGFLFSTLAPAQMPAMQMTFFFFLPSSLLSGFMFPFDSMPAWARTVGELLPLTHFLRVVRGVVLRGAAAADVSREILPMLAFAVAVAIAGTWTCRRALRASAV